MKKKTKQVIKIMPNSNCTGYDSVSNKTIKKCGNTIVPHLTHLINSIIHTGKFPQIYKISRIFPISKQDKPKHLISSYRPINNLTCIEKIVEHYIKEKLEEYFENNKILQNEHHGGRRDHSTLTALTKINNSIYLNGEKGFSSAIITTDLTAAYDTVDHDILLEKLKFYGINNNEHNLFKSYLENRKQFVKLDTFQSNVTNSLSCSVVQGSKLSGLFYTIYVNELPKLHLLIKGEISQQINNKNKN